MKMLAGGIATLLLTVTHLAAQMGPHEYSNPSVPSRQTLDRVNLELAWRVYLPVEGRRDGIFSFQQLDRKQIVVQTLSGVIALLDAETGAIQWKTGVGRPYQAAKTVGFNSKQIFAERADRVYAIDRVTGRMLWRYTMPNGSAAAPLADDEGLYLSLANGRIYAYALPDVEDWKRKQKGTDRGSEFLSERSTSMSLYGSSGIDLEKLVEMRKDVGPEPQIAWEMLFEEGKIAVAPLQTTEALLFATANGWIFSTSKFERHERFRFQAEAPVSAPLGQHGDMAYVASEDFNLYAVDLGAAGAGRIRWRFITGAPILQKPAVTDRDVFVAADRRGLFRINRANGQAVWQNTNARRFLAASPRFVYAFDQIGRLLVLDYTRGTQLGTLSTRAFAFPIANELNDRLFLAAHNGLLVCLRDHNLKTPHVNKTLVEKKVEGFKREEKKKAEDEKKKPREDKKLGDDDDNPKKDKKKLGDDDGDDKPKEDKKKAGDKKKKPKEEE